MERLGIDPSFVGRGSILISERCTMNKGHKRTSATPPLKLRESAISSTSRSPEIFCKCFRIMRHWRPKRTTSQAPILLRRLQRIRRRQVGMEADGRDRCKHVYNIAMVYYVFSYGFMHGCIYLQHVHMYAMHIL